jgi:ribosomal protein L27
VKEHENHKVNANDILVRQLGYKVHPGFGVKTGSDYSLVAQFDGTVRFVHWNVHVRRAGRDELHRRVYMCVEPTPEVAASLVRGAAPGDLIPPFTKERLLQLTLGRAVLPGSAGAAVAPSHGQEPAWRDVVADVLARHREIITSEKSKARGAR